MKKVKKEKTINSDMFPNHIEMFKELNKFFNKEFKKYCKNEKRYINK